MKLGRFFALFLAVCLLVSMASACGQNVTTVTTATTAATTKATTKATTAATTATTAAPTTTVNPNLIPPISDVPVSLSIAVPQNTAYGRPSEEVWLWKYLSQYHNLNFTIEQILADAVPLRKSLILASNDLPDIMLGMGITADEYVRYGQQEGQFLALSDYISEEATPNITLLFNKTPGAKASVTLQDGKIYGLPIIGLPYNCGNYVWFFWQVHRPWLTEVGKPEPKSVEELLETLRAIKAAAGTGTIPKDVIPLGGGQLASNPQGILLEAFGFIGGRDYNTIVLVDDVPTLVCYDQERFSAYLRYMRTLYSEGLISQDFYTMDGSQSNALLSNGKYAYTSELAAATLASSKADSGSVFDWSDYWICAPFSSQYNPQAVVEDVPLIGGGSIGSFAASAKTKYPEVMAKFADFWYSDAGTLISAERFPSFDINNEYNLGMFEVKWDDTIDNAKAYFPNGKTNLDEGQAEYITPVYPFLCYQDYMEILHKIWGKTLTRMDKAPIAWQPYRVPANIDRSNNDRWIFGAYDQFMSHTTGTPFPSIVYLNADSAAIISDLKTSLKEYADTEIAKFVTGATPLDDAGLTAYFTGLKNLGADTLVNFYRDYYDTLKSSTK